MKTFYYLSAITIAAVYLMVSCTPSVNYDNAIIDYLLRDGGQKAKIAVKIHNTKDMGKVSLGGNAQTDQTQDEDVQLPLLEEQLATLQDQLFKLEVEEDGSGREIMETYITKISNLQQQIEDLKGKDAEPVEPTTKQISGVVSAVLVQCEYSVIYLSQNKEVIETKSFLVSEDGGTCYGLIGEGEKNG